MRDQLNKFIAAQEQENVLVREQIDKLFALLASSVGSNSPTRPTPPPPPYTKIDSPMGDVATHATSSTGGNMERVERTA